MHTRPEVHNRKVQLLRVHNHIKFVARLIRALWLSLYEWDQPRPPSPSATQSPPVPPPCSSWHTAWCRHLFDPAAFHWPQLLPYAVTAGRIHSRESAQRAARQVTLVGGRQAGRQAGRPSGRPGRSLSWGSSKQATHLYLRLLPCWLVHWRWRDEDDAADAMLPSDGRHHALHVLTVLRHGHVLPRRVPASTGFRV